MKLNKVWGCITTAKAIEKYRSYKFFFANANHILVISDEQPEGMVEMTEEYIKLFKGDDWLFINSVAEQVQREQMEKYPEEAEQLEREGMEFLQKFRQELEAVRVGANKEG